MYGTRLKILIFTGMIVPAAVWAWGERGHHTIGVVAAKLVQDPDLRKFLTSRTNMMGHVGNIPDIYWRQLPDAKAGDATHFLNPQDIGYAGPADVPTDYAKIIADHPGVDVSGILGSNWWRAAQFYQLALDAGTKATAAKTPAEFNAAVFDYTTNMGLMGHFVGDATMPFHINADYDGWKTGHGGIHSYYEGQVVNALDLNLDQEVFEAAQKLGPSKAGTVVERMKAISVATTLERDRVLAADPVLKPSTGDVHDKDKQPAQRTPADQLSPEAKARLHDLIVAQLARASKQLAEYWDELYVKAGKPPLSQYHSYDYPLEPAFVAPDYTGCNALKSL